MISLNNVYKRYTHDYAVCGVSFQVQKGEVLGFLGPNGAGKTTTMRIITGAIAPTSGNVSIAGMDVLTHNKEIKKLIGYMPENNPLYSDLKVKEYLIYRGKLKGCRGKKLKSRLEYVVENCIIEDALDKLIANLSKGYRQRVGLAETLIHDPQILILDEPTVGLDPAQIRQVRDLIKSLGKDRTVILSTHILPEVEATCNRVVIINKGKIQAMDTTLNLSKMYRGINRLRLEIKNNLDTFEDFLNKTNWKWVAESKIDNQAIYKIDLSAQEDQREYIFSQAVNNKSVILEMHQEKTSLEDVFIEIVTEE